MSLVSRLALLVVVALAPLWAVQQYNEWQLRALREADVRDQALHLARETAAEIERTVEGIKELLVTLAALPIVRDEEPAACTAFFAKLRRDFADYLVIGAADRTGRAFCNSTRSDRAPDVSDRDYFKRVMATGAFSLKLISWTWAGADPCDTFITSV